MPFMINLNFDITLVDISQALNQLHLNLSPDHSDSGITTQTICFAFFVSYPIFSIPIISYAVPLLILTISVPLASVYRPKFKFRPCKSIY